MCIRDRASADPEAKPQPLLPAKRAPRLGLLPAAGPILQQGQKGLENFRRPLPPVLPGKEPVPWLEAGGGSAQAGIVRHAAQRKIADRDHMRAAVLPEMAAAVTEGIELF